MASFIEAYCQNQGGEINYIFLAKGSQISTKLTFTNSLGLFKTNLNKIKFDLIQIKIDQLIQSSLQSWQLRQSKYARIVIYASPI